MPHPDAPEKGVFEPLVAARDAAFCARLASLADKPTALRRELISALAAPCSFSDISIVRTSSVEEAS